MDKPEAYYIGYDHGADDRVIGQYRSWHRITIEQTDAYLIGYDAAWEEA